MSVLKLSNWKIWTGVNNSPYSFYKLSSTTRLKLERIEDLDQSREKRRQEQATE